MIPYYRGPETGLTAMGDTNMTHDPFREYVETHERGPLALFRQIRALAHRPRSATRDQIQIGAAVYEIRTNIEAMADGCGSPPLLDAEKMLDTIDDVLDALDGIAVPDLSPFVWDLHSCASEIFPAWGAVHDMMTEPNPAYRSMIRDEISRMADPAQVESCPDLHDALEWCAETAPWAHLSPAILPRP